MPIPPDIDYKEAFVELYEFLDEIALEEAQGPAGDDAVLVERIREKLAKHEDAWDHA